MKTEETPQKENNSNLKTAIKKILNGKFYSSEHKINEDSGAKSDNERTQVYSKDYQSQLVTPPPVPAFNNQSPQNHNDDLASTEESVITKDMTVDGNITLKSKIRILGSVKGNVTSTNDISVEGSIEGDVKCNNIQMTSGKIRGNLIAKSSIQLNESSVLVGDANANQVFCDGKIKGNIEASGLVALNQTAEVMGNIHAQSLRIQDNAVIKGNTDIFRDEKRKEEELSPSKTPSV